MEKEMQLPDLPDISGKTANTTSPPTTNTDLNAETTSINNRIGETVRQGLPVEMTTAPKPTSLTVKTTDTTTN